MNYEDKILLSSVMSKLTEWEDKMQDLYGHMNKLEKLIIQSNAANDAEIKSLKAKLVSLEASGCSNLIEVKSKGSDQDYLKLSFSQLRCILDDV